MYATLLSSKMFKGAKTAALTKSLTVKAMLSLRILVLPYYLNNIPFINLPIFTII
jgi:hypothetical protein